MVFDLRTTVATLLVLGSTSLLADDAPTGSAEDQSERSTPAASPEAQPPETTKTSEPADPEAGAKEGAKPDGAEGEADPLERWDALRKRKLEIAERLAELKSEFESARPAERTTIRGEFGELLTEYQLDVADGMEGLAEKVHAERPDDPEAAGILMRQAFARNQYARAAELAESVIAADDTKYRFAAARRIAAVSEFALHHFEKAAELLAEVESKPGWVRYQSLEKPYLEPAAKEYVELWVAEQAIRAKEEALEGDERLPKARLAIVDEEGNPKGDVEILLFEDEAPNTVASFVKSVQDGAYDGTPFHRVIENFMAQGGQLTPPVPWSIASEYDRESARKHFRGSLSVANLGTPGSGSSQFFITVLPTFSLNGVLGEDGEPVRGHTVFGRVVKGMDVVDAIVQGDEIAEATMLHVRPHPYEPMRVQDAPVADDKAPEGEKKEELKTPFDLPTKPPAEKPFELRTPKPDSAKPDSE